MLHVGLKPHQRGIYGIDREELSMKRLMPKCTPEFRKRTGCGMMEDGDICEYCTPASYCGYYETMNSKGEKQLFKQFDRLGQLEDETEQREKGCNFCDKSKRDGFTVLFEGDDITDSMAFDMHYCPVCGRKLV